MFLKTNKDDSANTKIAYQAESSAISLIAVGTEIKGDFSCKGDVRIDGKIKGHVTTQGKLVIGQSAEIIGNVSANNAEILGVVQGHVTVSELLSLVGVASVSGDIRTKKLVVESGVLFQGHCSVGALTSPSASKDNPNVRADSKEDKKAGLVS